MTSKKVTVPVDSSAELTPAEIKEAIEAFDTATVLRLGKAAGYFSRGLDMEANDLLHEAVLRSLTEDRTCPRQVPVATFLWNTMRSIRSAALKERRLNPVESVDPTSQDNVIIEAEHPDPSPEDHFINADAVNRLIREMESLFEDDEDAQLLLVGLFQGMTRKEIQTECNLSDTQYDTIRKRIRRKLDERYPEGWKS
ncbi:MAG: sigma-70 family RNA polymerase sigma factor [Gammaproteobacteria bacterium]|nr:sigma-70 family RNA polymerase sigma factor [Gammaproteobacteria bacterium]